MIIRTAPAQEAVVSWATSASAGTIDLTVYRSDGQVSGWLPYVRFDPAERASLGGEDDVAKIEIDIVRAPVEIVAVEVRSNVSLDAVMVSTPRYPPPATSVSRPKTLEITSKSQYVAAHPAERAWCAPTTMAMLLSYWGIQTEVADVAARVRDASFGGTGNWAFNVAIASAFGLRGAVIHLRDLAHAARFIDAGIPLALSFAWKSGELPGAPVEHTDGHLGVLRGFSERGDPIVNDPAQSSPSTTYHHDAFERAWKTHGAVACVIVPPDRTSELLRLANT